MYQGQRDASHLKKQGICLIRSKDAIWRFSSHPVWWGQAHAPFKVIQLLAATGALPKHQPKKFINGRQD